jgi:mRNA interferase MazF
MKQSEIWLLNLDPTIGAEIQKIRPVLIVSEDALGVLPLRIIVPITDWKERYNQAPWMVQIEPNRQNGLSKPSAADAFQVRSVSKNRFIKKLGNVEELQMEAVRQALAKVLSIDFS